MNSFDIRTYRRRVQRWRQMYAGLTASIREMKRQAAYADEKQPDFQRALTILQDEARFLMLQRQEMKDYWHMCNSRPADIYLGVVIFT